MNKMKVRIVYKHIGTITGLNMKKKEVARCVPV